MRFAGMNLLIMIFSILTLGCSTSEKVNDNFSVDVVQSSVDAWFDLMPGTSPGKFHLAGELELINSAAVDIENINLERITVYSNVEVIYNFKPYFNPRLKEDKYSLKIGSGKEFTFGSESGIRIDPRLEESNLIDIKLHFTLGEENFIYEIKNIEITRAY